jgi:hypothetical protein
MASQYGYDIAYPYAGDGKFGDIFRVAAQKLGLKVGATNTAAAIIADVKAQTSSTGGPSAFLSWSGGATAIQSARIGANNASAVQVFFSPGASNLPSSNTNSLLLSGSGLLDGVVNLTSGTSTGGTPGCGHDAACMWDNNRNAINDLLDNGTLGPVQSCPNPTVFLPHGGRIPLSLFLGGGGSLASPGQWWYFPPTSGENGDSSIGGGWVYFPGSPSGPAAPPKSVQ